MEGCSFQLLGCLNITLEGQNVTSAVPGGKARLLMAYLILAYDRPQNRKQMAFDFWPDSTDKQALSNLRKLLHDLQEKVPQIGRYLIVTPTNIQWNHELPFYSDVREFEQAAQGQTLRELRRADELYRGELLPGFYEEWLGAKRELLSQTHLSALKRLIQFSESRRDYSSALLYANKLLVRNKAREETYRTLMRLHALNKDMTGVMQTYVELQTNLQVELGVDPAEETLQLLKKLTQNGGEPSNSAYSPASFIGRIGEWGALLSSWEQATEGRNSLLILKGEAGIGKTRLAQEFVAWVKSHGEQTAFAGCYPSTTSLSYTPVRAWLRSLPLPQLSPVWLTELSRLLPELHERYPDLPMPKPVQEKWQLGRWYGSIERMLLAKQPLLLMLDDLQWCDRETLRLLSYLLSSESKVQLFVIATYRTDEDPGDAVKQFVSGLRIERKLTEIELEPLSGEESKRLMASIVGDDRADRYSSGLYAETGGNPLFIVETLREWQSAGSSEELRLSPLVKSVIENRLGKLSPSSRRLTATIAALGRPVSTAFLTTVTAMDEEAVLERIELLTQVKVLQETKDGQYEFTHEMIRETVYKLMNESRRRGYHRQIARSLSEFHYGQPEAMAAEIAFHYELAGMKNEAIVYYEAAAWAAEKIYANETRIKYYQKLCVLLPPEQILPVLMKLGDALIIVGDWNEAEKSYRQWLERSGSSAGIRERSFCDAALGNCLRLQGKYEEAGFQLERALRCFELMEDISGLSFVYVTLGILHYYRGNYDKVHYYSMKRSELPDVGNRPQEDCRFFGIMGHLFYDQCEYDQAIHWIKKQIGLASEIRDKYSVEQAMGLLAMVYMDIDEMDRAFDVLVDKMEISKSIGDRMGFAIALGMLGKHYGYLGHYAHASPCIVFCLEEAVAIKDWRIAAIMLSFEGRSLLAQQRLEEADHLLGRSIRMFNQLRIPYFASETLYFISLLRQRQVQCESAVQAAEEALHMANQLKRKDMQVNLLVQLSHLKTGLGQLSSGDAEHQLRRMLEQYPGRQVQAAIHYAMWKLDSESMEYRKAALSLNEELHRQSGKEEYAVRCREMNGLAQSAAARPMPKLAGEVTQCKSISPILLEEIDRYLKL